MGLRISTRAVVVLCSWECNRRSGFAMAMWQSSVASEREISTLPTFLWEHDSLYLYILITISGFSRRVSSNTDPISTDKLAGSSVFNGNIDPNELALTFVGLHVCVQFGENRRRNATVRVSTDRHTHAHTHAHTDRRKTILLSVPCYML